MQQAHFFDQLNVELAIPDTQMSAPSDEQENKENPTIMKTNQKLNIAPFKHVVNNIYTYIYVA